MPNWVVKEGKGFTVALDVELDEELYLEGIARDIVHELQYMRKLLQLKYDDYIIVEWEAPGRPKDAMAKYEKYIKEEARISWLIQDVGPGQPLGECVRTCVVGTGHKLIILGMKKDILRE
jgi:hypothetical protein